MVKQIRRYWPVLFAAVFVFLIIWIVASSEPFQACVQSEQQQGGKQATKKSVAKVATTLDLYRDGVGCFIREDNPDITALATLFIAAFTFTLWQATRGMLKVSTEQGQAMERSIAESARAAYAMEQVAGHFADNVATFRERSAQQMRAYVTVVVCDAIYQERAKGLRFEAKPLMLNTGHTPAQKVYYKASAKILPIPLPPDFDFPLPRQLSGGVPLGPQQNFIMNAFVEEFYDDARVETIKRANGEALYVWGIVYYEDAFGETRHTKFCHFVRWVPNPPQPDRIFGTYVGEYSECT